LLASRDKISIRQAVLLFIIFVLSASIRLFPTYAARAGERAGWLAPVFAVLPFICLVFIIQALFKNNRESNLSDIIFKALGRIFGTVLLIIYLIWILISLGIIVRYFAEKFLTSILPNTTVYFFVVTILAVVFYALRSGIVYTSRTAEFLFLIFLAIFFLLFVLSIPRLEVINLFPVTYYDIVPVLKASFSIIGTWSVFTFVFFFGDRINDKEHIKRFGMQGMVFLTITALMILIQTIGVYGYSVIERVSMPYVIVTKSISLLETIERIESVAAASWVIIDFVSISVFVYVAVSIIKSLFSLSDVKPLISPVVTFAAVFSLYIAQSRFELESFSSHISIPVNIALGFIFPLIVLIVGKARKKI